MPARKITIIDGEEWTSRKLAKKIPGLSIKGAASRIHVFKKGKITQEQLFSPKKGIKKKQIVALQKKVQGLGEKAAETRLLEFQKGNIDKKKLYAPALIRVDVDGEQYNPTKLQRKVLNLGYAGARHRLRKFKKGEITKEQLFAPAKKKILAAIVDEETYTVEKLMEQISGLGAAAATQRIVKYNSGKITKEQFLKPSKWGLLGKKAFTPEDIMKKVPGLSRRGAQTRLRKYRHNKISADKLFFPHRKHTVKLQKPLTDKEWEEKLRRKKVYEEFREMGKIEEAARQRLIQSGRHDDRGFSIAPVSV